MLHIKESQKYQTIFINAYLIIYSIWLIITFLDTTMFHINYPNFTDIVLLEITVIFVGIKMILFNKHSKFELWLYIVLIISFGGSFINSGYVFLLPVLFLILGAKNVPFKNLLQIYCVISVVLILLTVIASQTGVVENLIYERKGQRISFGFNYPTDFTAHIFFFVMGYCYLRRERLSYLELMVILGFGFFSHIFCGARTNALCLLLTFIVFLYLKNRYFNRSSNYVLNKIFSRLLVFSIPISALCIVILTFLYQANQNNVILTSINNLLSNRLCWNIVGLERYGIHLYGSIFKMIGLGGSTTPPNEYFFLDSSYILILLRYGVMVFVTTLVISVFSSLRAERQKDITLLLIISLIAIQSVVEHHLLDIAYNPFLFLIFSENFEKSTYRLSNFLKQS
jgi:hypothetical protein